MFDVFEVVGVIYWSAAVLYAGAAVGVLYLALKRPKSPLRKAMAAIAVLFAFGVLPAMYAKEAQDRRKAETEFEQYRAAAWAHFQKRCKENAGERIRRSVENVPGLLLLKRRLRATDAELRDQYWRGDPYGHDSVLPDSEIRNFVGYLNERGLATTRPTGRPGYLYVETKESHGGYRRYELDTAQLKILEVVIERPVSRHGVTWDDVSTDEDRRYWVAGGRLQVIDLETNEVLGERIGYLIEPGFGSQSAGRVPWGHARFMTSDRAACPPFRPKSLVPINRLFVEKVLIPARSEAHGK